MEYTTTYQLPQWESEDRILMDDFNDAMEKIEGAIPRLASGTYTGNGTHNSGYTELDVGFPPKFVFVSSKDGGRFLMALPGTNYATIAHSNSSNYLTQLVWTETGVKWRNTSAASGYDQLNESGATYYWLAIG